MRVKTMLAQCSPLQCVDNNCSHGQFISKDEAVNSLALAAGAIKRRALSLQDAPHMTTAAQTELPVSAVDLGFGLKSAAGTVGVPKVSQA